MSREASGSRWPDNRLVLTGRLRADPAWRQSPAGIRMARFTLEHESRQPEVDAERRVRFRIDVQVTAVELVPVVEHLQADDAVRVAGYLATAGGGQGAQRLVVQARRLERIDTEF